MEALLAWLFLAVVVERIIEILSKVFPILDDINIKELNIKLLIAGVFGGLFAFGGQLNFFDMVGINFIYPYVGEVISAVFIMAGSNYIADLINALNKTKETDIIVVEVERED